MAPKPPASLVRYLRNGRCVLFCGSGLSAWARLPTWGRLLEAIVQQLSEELPDDPSLAELQRLLEAGKLLEVADHCKEALGRRYNDILSEQLRGGEGEIPEPHKVIVRMPFSAAVTTNYDKLLERSYASVGSLPKTPTHRDVDTLGPLLFDGSFFILKAHGDIDRPESMVLTARDYQEIIHANPAFNSIFSAILLTKAILFVGYSLNDPDFRLLLDRQFTIFGGNVPDRYALMSGVGKVERDVLWRTARIRVLPYDQGQHGQVLEFLQMLEDQLSSTAAAALAPLPPPPMPAPGVAVSRSVPDLASRTAEVTFEAPATALSIRLSGQKLLATVGREDIAVQGEGAPPNWTKLNKITSAALTMEAQAHVLGKELAKLLPAAAVSALREVSSDQSISLILSPELELLPWEMTEIDGRFLVLRNPLVRAPVGVSDSARGYPAIRQPTRILLIGDPNQADGMPLPGALAEVNEVAHLYTSHPGAEAHSLIGQAASFEAVAAELSSGRYDIVHFAGHAWFDEDSEPYLLLSEQVKFRSSELRSLVSPRPPAILMLNSHFTIFTPPGAWGENSQKPTSEAAQPAPGGQRGFIDAASRAGVGILIGSYSDALDDQVAQAVGVELHKGLLAGEPVAKALHHALVLSAPKGSGANPSHLTYAMSGYGDIRLRL